MKKLLAIVLFCAFLVPSAYGQELVCSGNTCTYPDGGTYKGGWKASAADKDIKVRTGQGTYTSATKDVYVGEFKEGKEDGQGTQTWANGNKYVGEFKEGKMTGKGTFTASSGSTYAGEFKNGEENGQGTYTWSNGNKYVGECNEDKRT